jgi:hypothetical protein
MTTTSLQAPRLAATSAARPAASVWQRLWAALEAHCQRRAAAELRRLAIHHRFSDPALAQRLHRIAADTDAPA